VAPAYSGLLRVCFDALAQDEKVDGWSANDKDDSLITDFCIMPI